MTANCGGTIPTFNDDKWHIAATQVAKFVFAKAAQFSYLAEPRIYLYSSATNWYFCIL